MKKSISLPIRIAVSITLMYYLIRKSHMQTLVSTILSARWEWLGLAVFTVCSGIVISALRWKMLLDSQGIMMPFKKLFSFYMIGLFFNNFLPTSIGGDAVRVTKAARESREPHHVVSSVIVERATGFLCVSCIASVAMFAGYRNIPRNPYVFWTVILMTPFFLALAYAFTRRRIFGWLVSAGAWLSVNIKTHMNNIYASLHDFKGRTKTLIRVILLGFVFQFIKAILPVYFISRALGMDTGFYYFLVFMPVITLLTMIPVSLNGIGIREGSFVFFFGMVGYTPEQALSVSLLAYAVLVIFGICGGVTYILDGWRKG